jgi:hypothetical protein
MSLPDDKKARKERPIMRGLLDYFPDACAEVANVSFVGNEQHNPGQEMHWARGKSSDHADCAVRHLMERGTFDTDGLRHTAKAVWRALAELQEELEREGAILSRGSKAAVYCTEMEPDPLLARPVLDDDIPTPVLYPTTHGPGCILTEGHECPCIRLNEETP